MTVHDLLKNVPSSELTEWMAYLQLCREDESANKTSTPEVLKAMFANRVVKKGKK